MAAKIDNYYNRFAPAKGYTAVLLRDGHGMQASEINEIQSMDDYRITRLANALFKDGDIISGAQITVDPVSGHVIATAGSIYINGRVWDVEAAEMDIPVTGAVAVGISLVREIISEMEDPALRNPARGCAMEGEPGAWREKTVAIWAHDASGQGGDFFPVYAIDDGQQRPREAPPTLDSFNVAISRYDRDSTGGGSYVCSGLGVIAEASEGDQIFSIGEGRARVNGEGVEFLSSRRLRYAPRPDLRYVDTEVITATGEDRQRVDVAHAPVHEYVNLRVTQRKTVTVIHGNYAGCQDPLPDTAVLQIVSVVQGGKTFAPDADYRRFGDTVDWAPGGDEPATGSSYQVTYDFLNTNIEPLDPDYDGFYVEGAVPGSSIMISYNQALPRIDALCLNADGTFSWVQGVASEYSARKPQTPAGSLALCSVCQKWRGIPEVINDAEHVFSFSFIQSLYETMQYCLAEVARNRLEMDAGTREAGARAGLFVDPLLDDAMRDQGVAQTAAIVDGALVLPIAANVLNVSADIKKPASAVASVSVGLAQTLKTGQMRVNPYMAFAVPEGSAEISPSVDRWVETKTEWASSATKTFYSYSNRMVHRTSTTSNNIEAGTRLSSSSSTSTRTATDTENLGTITSAIKYLREIPVGFTLTGFGAGEILDEVNFGGVRVSFSGTKTADATGKITGSFKIPPSIPAGVKQIAFVGRATTAYATFTGQGILEVTTLRRVQKVYKHVTTTTTVTSVRFVDPDPLAQTFSLESDSQLAGIELWFMARGSTNAQVQLREVQSGFPTGTVLAEALVPPASQLLNGQPTRAMFDAPVPLTAGQDYAIVILCNDAQTALAVAEMGQFDTSQQKYVTQQPYTVGVLLSSSNATTWTAHQTMDLAFRLLMASYDQTETTIDLGGVTLPEGTTDLVLMGLAEQPSSACRTEFVLELPDGTSLTLAGEQGVSLDRAVSGEARVKAKLFGDARAMPVLWPGTQVIAGRLASSGSYCTRSVVARDAKKAVLVYDAYAPSGSSVLAELQIDGGVWETMPLATATPQGDGIAEYRHEAALSGADLIKVRFTLSGTPKARPEVYDIRLMSVK